MATEKPGYGDSYSETTTRKRAMNSIMERSMDMAVENTVMAGYAVTKGDGCSDGAGHNVSMGNENFCGKKIASDLLKFILKLIQ